MYKLEVNEEDVARYLGVKKGHLDEAMKVEIEVATRELVAYVEYKIEYRAFDIVKKEDAIYVEGTNLKLEGKAIQDLLEDCNQCILLAVTLGQSVDSYLRKLQVTDLSKAVVTDFCASSMVEELCNQVDYNLKGIWREKNRYLTDRFSPGYSDLSLDVQSVLCNVLDTSRRMGLHVSSSGLMIPRKSITGIIGISKVRQKMKIKGCNYCDFYKDCTYRKGGKICD